MNEKTKEIAQLVEDFHYLKQEIMKINRVYRFISSKVLRPVYLLSGILVCVFALAMQWLIGNFNSYADIPRPIKAIYYILLVISGFWAVRLKIRVTIKRFKELGLEITLGQLLKEVYTSNTLIVGLPFMISIGLVAIYLAGQGLHGYLVPSLAILYGLLICSMVNILYLKELIVGGIWILASGFVVLFGLGPVQPMLALFFTFGLGFIVMYLVSLLSAKDDQ